jgi:hypothetical protein
VELPAPGGEGRRGERPARPARAVLVAVLLGVGGARRGGAGGRRPARQRWRRLASKAAGVGEERRRGGGWSGGRSGHQDSVGLPIVPGTFISSVACFVRDRVFDFNGVKKMAGEEGAVRAARHGEAAGDGAGPAGAAAGEHHASAHAGTR